MRASQANTSLTTLGHIEVHLRAPYLQAISLHSTFSCPRHSLALRHGSSRDITRESHEYGPCYQPWTQPSKAGASGAANSASAASCALTSKKAFFLSP